MEQKNTHKIISLHTFITIAICLIVTVTLLFSGFFYYNKTAGILLENYERSFTSQLTQVNQKISDQIAAVDSVAPLFLSDTRLLDILESPDSSHVTSEQKLAIERQMSSMYYRTSIASHNFTDSIFIISKDKTLFHIYTSGSFEPYEEQNAALLSTLDKSQPYLICRILPFDENSIYFIRNLFNSNTGNYMGTFFIRLNRERWMDYCVEGLDPSWFICLYNQEMTLVSNEAMQSQSMELAALSAVSSSTISFREEILGGQHYFVASERLSGLGLTSAVVAPKDLLLKDLNSTLKTYLLFLALTVFIALAAAVLISQMITTPIKRMIYHINQISEGKSSRLPSMKMYHEFEIWADSFNRMLQQLDTYYTDNFQKRLLLKNAEIRALQAQMNPHFLFNVLNTIAWKAQIINNEEIYQMVISLGELLKANTFSREADFIELEKEMSYVKFYVYLQQRRFEDKIDCIIQIPEELMQCKVPCFCIQPLVENAIIHGLEPKKGKGKLIIQILTADSKDCADQEMEIAIIDNGVGFTDIPDVRNISSSSKDSHTHIGLKNLDKRLELLFGESARIKIESIPNLCTTISFRIPKKGETHDI
ncbi:MAG: sensor histidine kinase [Lachnospiraceae bacterium]|nr:sensor histidine kinase [Lachnospiraceae bacterium]